MTSQAHPAPSVSCQDGGEGLGTQVAWVTVFSPTLLVWSQLFLLHIPCLNFFIYKSRDNNSGLLGLL